MLARLSPPRILLLLVLSLFCLLVCPNILVLGKNGDGVEYAAVARNMAQGWGTFWSPYLSETMFKVHHEHPPLVYWIQALWFRLLGDGPYVEGVYGFIIGGVILYGTALLWHRVHRDFGLPDVGPWWPLFLLLSLPYLIYIVQSNRLVLTFMVFAIFATFCSYRSLVAGSQWGMHAFLSGVLIYLGCLAKGPVALFTLAVPAIAWITLNTPLWRASLSTAVALITCAVSFLATAYLYPESLDFWQGFWQAQVMASLTSARTSGSTHFLYIERWIAEMIVPFALVGVLMLLTREPWRRLRFNRQAWFFLGIAWAGSLPFLVSTRQHLRYILHAFPFFMLSVAFLTENIAARSETIVSDKRGIRRGLSALAVLFFAVSLGAMLYRQGAVTNRDAFFRDLYFRDITLPERIMVSVYPETLIYDDLLFTDMQRFFKVSVTHEMGHDYMLVDKHSDYVVPEGYRAVHQQPTVKYLLYKKTADTVQR